MALKLIRICKIKWWCSLFLFSKFKIVCLKWNLVARLIQICKVQWWCSIFSFWLEIPILGKFGPKSKIVYLKWNLLSRLFQKCRINDNVYFFYFWPKIPFLGKFIPKNQNCLLKLKFRTYTNSNMWHSMAIFIFFFFRWEIPFFR